jgi:hypothetical protein
MDCLWQETDMDGLSLEQLKELNEKLKKLLNDPQPGLFTWHEFVHMILDEMAVCAPGYVKREPDYTKVTDVAVLSQAVLAAERKLHGLLEIMNNRFDPGPGRTWCTTAARTVVVMSYTCAAEDDEAFR